MKSLLKITLIINLLILAACGQPDTRDSNGNSIYLSSYKDKWLILNYWATWCKPCREEMPALSKLYTDHKDTLVVMGINYDHLSPEKLSAFSKENPFSYPLITTDLGAAFGIGDVSVLPATFLISPERKLVKKLYGPQTEASILAFINAES